MRNNPKLYEINTVEWLYELSNKYGRQFTIGTVPQEEWDWFEKSGFGYVWLMGIWKRSKAGIRIFQNGSEYPAFKSLFDSVLPGWSEEKDLTGSPYSIASYGPDPLIGSWEDIDIARDELRNRKIGLVLDFVPNHTAPDHPWIFEKPDYYIQAGETDYQKDRHAYLPIHREEKTLYLAHGKDPYFPPWTDTVQLNYFNPGTRLALINELNNISHHCDGVRCDMAMLVLNNIFQQTWGHASNSSLYKMPESEFWQDVRKEVPGMLLIAEAYWDTESILLSLGFDYVYDKRLYDRLRYSSPTDIVSHLRAEQSYQKKLVRFIENHDEPRSAGTFSREKLAASAVLFSTLPGMKLYHHGQFEGKKIRLPVQLRRAKHEDPDNELQAFYEKLLSITNLAVFSLGNWELRDISPAFDDSYRNLIAYTWSSEKDLALVVVNLDQQYSQGRISLERVLTSEDDCVLVDELNGQVYKRNGKEMRGPGLHVILEGFHSHIFYIPKDFSF